MIHRQTQGTIAAKLHTALRLPDGKLAYEEMHTRDGFEGAYTAFYHLGPVVTPRSVRVSDRAWPAPRAEEAAGQPLMRRLYDANRIPKGGMLAYERTPILVSTDTTLWLAAPNQSDDVYVADADGDELWFVLEGRATVESYCGLLEVGTGDYVFIPRAFVHRWRVPPAGVRLFGVQARRDLGIPASFRNDVGQLRMDAPYTHRDFAVPEGPIATASAGGAAAIEGPRDLLVVKGGHFSLHELERCPMDVIGWDGFVYPFAFPIEKYQPKTGLVHLPPTTFTTFAGSGMSICSFVPRLLDYHKDAIPCPYPHSNVHCDEVILYLRGDFTSRRGVGSGMISLHPAGIAHGPHPGAYEASLGKTRTDELAVMIDATAPLLPTAQAANIEHAGYHATWSEPAKG